METADRAAPTRILVECPEEIASVRLGVLEPLRPLEKAGRCKVRFRLTQQIRNLDIEWADVLVTVRGCDPATTRIVRKAKKNGRKIIYYLDDDLMHVPRESLTWEYYNDPVVVDGLKECLAASDYLWGSNTRIRDAYLSLTQSAQWIHSHVPKRLALAPPEGRGISRPVKLVYAGSTDHTVLVHEVITPALRRICEEYGDGVDITFIGVKPDMPVGKNVHYIPYIASYDEYQDYVTQQAFAIGLAPGRVEPFYACKYFNKFVEYAAMGAVGVYTKAEPFTQVVEDGVNGVLCDNTLDAWYTGIRRLLDDPALLDCCARASYVQLLKDFSHESVASRLEERCPLLCCFRAPEARLGPDFLSRLAFYWSRALIVFRRYGILAVYVLPAKAVKKGIQFLIREVKHIVP